MGCGCGTKAVKESSAKQVVRAGATRQTVSQKTVLAAKKPVTRRVIKRPAR